MKHIFKGIEHPDTLYYLAGSMEHGLFPQLQGIEKHTVKIPERKAQHRIQRNAGLVSAIPAPPFIFETVLQLFQEFG